VYRFNRKRVGCVAICFYFFPNIRNLFCVATCSCDCMCVTVRALERVYRSNWKRVGGASTLVTCIFLSLHFARARKSYD
jgi:hypothetical protein